jgi:hypothetical protein
MPTSVKQAVPVVSDANRTVSKIKKLFSNPDFVGNVIRYTALLEFEVDCLLAQYFLRVDRIDEGISLLIEDLRFGAKVDTLAELPVRKSVASFGRAIAGLRRFGRVRNLAAHSWTVSSREVKKLLGGTEYKRMLMDYPGSLCEEFIATRTAVERLSRVGEFLGAGGRKIVDSGMRAIERILSDNV